MYVYIYTYVDVGIHAYVNKYIHTLCNSPCPWLLGRLADGFLGVLTCLTCGRWTAELAPNPILGSCLKSFQRPANGPGNVSLLELLVDLLCTCQLASVATLESESKQNWVAVKEFRLNCHNRHK